MFLLPHHCGWPDCNKPVIGDISVCGHCDRILCSEHIEQPYHQCMILKHARETTRKSKQAYWTPLVPKLCDLDLAQQASKLRPGHTCTARLPTSWKQAWAIGLASQLNTHFFIDFDDGVKWLVRIRERKPWSPPLEMQLRIDESEVATMQALKGAGLPVPGAWRTAEAENVAKTEGIFYFFIEYYHGKQLPSRSSPLVPDHLSQSHLEQLVLEYARFQIKLSTLKYGAIGCVLRSTEHGGDVSVGPFPSFCKPASHTLLGPYKTQRDRYCEQIEGILGCIASGGLFAANKEFATLAFIHAKRVVCDTPAMQEEAHEFFIKHPDDKGDIFFWSGDSLEGIIDWEWAYTTTAAEAFSSPYFSYSSPAYRKGSNALSHEEELLVQAYTKLDREDLAGYVKNGRIYNRLRDLLRGVLSIGTLDGLTLSRSPNSSPTEQRTRAEWMAWAAEQYQEDPAYERLREISLSAL